MHAVGIQRGFEFRPNDLSNTAVVGYTAGVAPVRLDVRSIFVGQDGDEWTRIPEVTAALGALDREYAFFRHSVCEPHYERVYGDYSDSKECYRMYGDGEQFSSEYAIWLEQQGVLRAWTRITYFPK